MITCKEDLFDTQILGAGALEYQRLAFEFGIGWNEAGSDLRLRPNYIGVTCKKYGNNYELASIRELSKDKGTKTITVNDLRIKQEKPTKFVKVEESIFDLKEEFERGELYMRLSDDYLVVPNETQLSILLDHKQCYRQVEIDWRDELAEFTGLGKDFYTWVDCIDGMYDFNFVEMCHLVASLTEKPE